MRKLYEYQKGRASHPKFNADPTTHTALHSFMTSVHCLHIACIPGTFIRERFKVFSGVLRPFLTFHPQCTASPSWFDTIEQSVTADHLFTISPLMISWWKSRCHQAYVTQPFAMPNSPRFREVTSWLGASRPVHSRFDVHPCTTTHWQWPLTKEWIHDTLVPDVRSEPWMAREHSWWGKPTMQCAWLYKTEGTISAVCP